jgi:alkylation response protein AidB-like acyl-CoA dehydrogenase
MSHYKPNLRDIEFNLFEVLGRSQVLGQGAYADVDAEVARDMLTEVARLAVEDLAPSLLDSDRNPPVFDPTTHSVTTPASFRASYQAYVDSEFWRADVPEQIGGTPVPPSLRWAMAEMILGSNPAVHMFASGFAFARVLHTLGSDDQKLMARWMVEKHWGATMVLTEPDAGSDVGAGRAKAVQQPDGSWHISGVKRFITSAVSDFQDNIVHLVLARPEGAGAGS